MYKAFNSPYKFVFLQGIVQFQYRMFKSFKKYTNLII